MIDKEQVKKMAEISKLEFPEDELDEIREKISSVLDQIGILKEVDLEGVEPTYNVNTHSQHFREDKVRESLTREEVVANTKEEQYGYFKLFKIVE